MVVLRCGKEGAPGALLIGVRAGLVQRTAHEGPRRLRRELRNRGEEGKWEVESGAGLSGDFNAHEIIGDAPGFASLRKVFEFTSMADAGEKGKRRGGRRKGRR